MEELTTLYLHKQAHKFSAAHFTIFSATERERLHGHNYAVSARIVAPLGENGFAADYNVYKRRLASLCDGLDEYMLLPAESPYLVVVLEGAHYRATFAGEDMTFLAGDTLLLPVRNVTVEELSRHMLARLVEESAGDDLREIELCVASGPGQKGCATWRKKRV